MGREVLRGPSKGETTQTGGTSPLRTPIRPFQFRPSPNTDEGVLLKLTPMGGGPVRGVGNHSESGWVDRVGRGRGRRKTGVGGRFSVTWVASRVQRVFPGLVPTPSTGYPTQSYGEDPYARRNVPDPSPSSFV